MIKHVLIAFDGSESAQKAYLLALDIAKKYGADLYVLAVARPPEFGDEVEIEAIIENSRKHYEKVLAPLKTQTSSAGVRLHFDIVVGHPAQQIVIYAEKHSVDHIVVGHRGRTLFKRWLMGSIAHQIIAYAHCAVTVVR